VGSLAGARVLAATFIALSCASLAGCDSQSNSAFHAVADPTPNAAAIQRQPPQTSGGDVATSASNAYAAQPRSPQMANADVAVAGSNSAAIQPQPGAASASASTSDYRIMSGDVLQITVFQVQDFNRDAQVDAAGNIALPLIGGVPAAGKTVHEVESEVAGRLRAKYLQNPQVLVTIKDAVGLRVSVQGAVKNPGVIQIRGDTTLTTVLAQAQGFTDTADKSSVLVVRNTDQGRVAGKVDAGAILAGSAPDPRIYGGDMIVVDDSFMRSAGKDALNVLGGAAMLRVFFP
jgi:polysaccharide export outer membrane protein